MTNKQIFGYFEFPLGEGSNRQMTVSGPLTKKHMTSSNFPFRETDNFFKLPIPYMRSMLTHELVLGISKQTGFNPKDIQIVQGYTKKSTPISYVFMPYWNNEKQYVWGPRVGPKGPLVVNQNGVYHHGPYTIIYDCGEIDMSFVDDGNSPFKKEEAIREHLAKMMKSHANQINIRYQWEFYEDSSSSEGENESSSE